MQADVRAETNWERDLIQPDDAKIRVDDVVNHDQLLIENTNKPWQVYRAHEENFVEEEAIILFVYVSFRDQTVEQSASYVKEVRFYRDQTKDLHQNDVINIDLLPTVLADQEG